MDPTLIVACGGLVVVVGAVLVWNSVPRRQRLKRFKNRPELSMEQIYSDFFAQKNLPRELVCELWREVAESMRIPPGKLRPNDRFDRELAAPRGWEYDDEILDVQWAAERRLRRFGSDTDLSHVNTIGDYVEFFCGLATKKHPWHLGRNESRTGANSSKGMRTTS